MCSLPTEEILYNLCRSAMAVCKQNREMAPENKRLSRYSTMKLNDNEASCFNLSPLKVSSLPVGYLNALLYLKV